MHVVFDHAIRILILARDTAQLLFHVSAEVHTGAVPPYEPWRSVLVRLANEGDSRVRGLVVHRFHPFFGQRAGVLDLLYWRPIRAVARRGADHAPGPERLEEGLTVGQDEIAWIVLVLRLFLSVEVIEVAVEGVESVVGGQVLVFVAKMVLAELTSDVSFSLE